MGSEAGYHGDYGVHWESDNGLTIPFNVYGAYGGFRDFQFYKSPLYLNRFIA